MKKRKAIARIAVAVLATGAAAAVVAIEVAGRKSVLDHQWKEFLDAHHELDPSNRP